MDFSYTADQGEIMIICNDIVPINKNLQMYTDEMTTHVKNLQNSQGYNRLSRNVLSEYVGVGDEYAGLVIDEANTFYQLAGIIAEFDAGGIDADKEEKKGKFWATLGMVGLNFAEGVGSGFESIIDGLVTATGAVGGFFGFSTDWAAEFVEKDFVGDAFEAGFQEGGIFSEIEKNSAYSYYDTQASIVKGFGTATTYLAVTALLGGAPVAEAVVTGVGTMGLVTQNKLQSGADFYEAAGAGAKAGVIAGVGEFVAGKVIEKTVVPVLTKGANKIVTKIDDVVPEGTALGKVTGSLKTKLDDAVDGLNKTKTTTKTSPDGTVSTKTLDSKGNVTSRTKEVIDADGVKTTTIVDEATGNTSVTTQKPGSPDKITNNFDADGKPTSTVKESFDVSGKKTSTSTTDAKTGETITQKYDVDGKTVTENSVSTVNKDGSIETKHYQGTTQDTLTGSTKLSTDTKTGITTTKEFDVNGKEISSTITDVDGKTISTSTTDVKTGEISTKTYGSDGKVTENSITRTNAKGNVETTIYDGDTQKTLKGRIEQEIDPNNNIKTKTYGSDGKTITENSLTTTDANGNVSTKVYDGDAQTTLKSDTIVDAKGNKTTTKYAADGTTKVSSSATDVDTGITNTKNYDIDGKTVKSMDTYDANNTKVSTTARNSNGEIETKYIDDSGNATGARRIETTDPNTGNKKITNYDENNKIKSEIEIDSSTGSKKKTNYDVDGKTTSIESTNPTTGKPMQTNYAADGKTIKSTIEVDQKTGNRIKTNYADDGITKTSKIELDANGSKTTTEMLPDGKQKIIKEVSTPDGKTTTIVEMDGNKVTTIDTPDGRHITETIDASGKTTKEIIDIDGTTTKITDGSNNKKIIETTSPDGTKVRATEFDDGTVKSTVPQKAQNAWDATKKTIKEIPENAPTAAKKLVTGLPETIKNPVTTGAAILGHLGDPVNTEIISTEVPINDNESTCPNCHLPLGQCACEIPGTQSQDPVIEESTNPNNWQNATTGGGGSGDDGGYDYPEYETSTYPEYEIPTYPEYETPTYPEYEIPTYPDTGTDGSDGNNGNDGNNGDNGSSYPWGDNGWGGGNSGPGASDFVDDLGNSLEDTNVSIEESLEDATASLDEIIDMTSGVNIPTSANPIKSTINTKDNNMVPLMAGLGAAALAGLGAKAYLDHKENKDNEEEIEAEEWEEDSFENENLGAQESDYLMPTDEFAYQPEGMNMSIEDEGERYQAVNSSELPSIN